MKAMVGCAEGLRRAGAGASVTGSPMAGDGRGSRAAWYQIGARGRSGVPGGLPAAGWLRGGDARDVFAPGSTWPAAVAAGPGGQAWTPSGTREIVSAFQAD